MVLNNTEMESTDKRVRLKANQMDYRKDKILNFRVDELRKNEIDFKSKNAGMTVSAYMNKVLDEYDNLVTEAQQSKHNFSQRKEAEELVRYFKSRLSEYQTKELINLYEQVKGKESNGILVRSPNDLINIMVSNFQFDTQTEETGTGKTQETVKLNQKQVLTFTTPPEKKNEKTLIILVVVIIIAVISYFVYKAKK